MTEAEAPDRERQFTSQDGLRLYYRDYGDALSPGAPVVCLGGLTRNSKDFHDLAMHLSPGRRVVCLDYRGRGRSAYDPDWRNYQPRTYINDIKHLLAAANLHGIVFVGTSLGGVLAMVMCVAAPIGVAGVVLNDIGPTVSSDGLGRILDYIKVDRPQPDWETAARHMRKLLPTLGLADDAEWLHMARNTFREGPDGLLHFDWDIDLARPLMADKAPAPDLWPYYRALRHIPALAIRGENSDILTTDTFDRMAVEKPDLRRLTVAGKGHTPTLGEPESLAAIDDFLAAVDLKKVRKSA
jgi:pimeloyl-ACP methyl ester carboxylesterase